MKSSVFLILSVYLCAIAIAEPATRPQGRDLTISSSGVVSPARKYRLRIDPVEQTAGNAAPIYQCVATLAVQIDEASSKRLEDWLELPINQLPKADVAAILQSRDGLLTHLDTAARRERCDWDLALREQGFAALLPHLAPLRTAARLVAIRTRLAIAEKRWNDAAYSIRTGYALAEHLGQGFTLIESLVALGISELNSQTVLDWIEAPNSPNLYWSLNELPATFVDIPACMQRERAWGLSLFPSIQRAMKGEEISSEEWHQGISRLTALVSGPAIEEMKDKLTPVAMSALLLAPARAHLLANGYTQEKLNAMQPGQIVARYVIDDYTKTYDDLTLWYSQPFWIAMPHILQDEAKFASTSRLGNPLYLLIPATSRAFESGARAQRTRVMLMTLEAIRDGLKRAGKLPAKLEELSDTPVPIDPTTGKLPEYVRHDGGFTLTSPATRDNRVESGARFDVTLRK